MSVASMLENMKRRALDSTYDAYICEEYDAWAVESFATEEGEYDAARLELPKVLSSGANGEVEDDGRALSAESQIRLPLWV